MKSISKFLNTIAGIFRILVAMSFLWGIIFTLFINRNLLTSFYDLLGFDSIAPEIIKMLTAIIFAFAFFINQLVARRIFKANKTGSYHMFNMVFGFIFLLIDLGIYFFTREEVLFYIIGFSAVLILGSMFGLGAKAKGLYPVVEIKPNEESQTPIAEEETIEESEDLKEETIENSEDLNEEETIDDIDDDEVYMYLDDEDLKEDSKDEDKNETSEKEENAADTKDSESDKEEVSEKTSTKESVKEDDSLDQDEEITKEVKEDKESLEKDTEEVKENAYSLEKGQTMTKTSEEKEDTTEKEETSEISSEEADKKTEKE